MFLWSVMEKTICMCHLLWLICFRFLLENWGVLNFLESSWGHFHRSKILFSFYYNLDQFGIVILSLWCSDFGDIFDTDHFLNSLKTSVRIVKNLPTQINERIQKGELKVLYMPPGSWSNVSYYTDVVSFHQTVCYIYICIYVYMYP